MNNDSLNLPQPEPVDQKSGSRRSLFLGSIIGVTAIVGSVFALSAAASANGDDKTALVSAQAQTTEVAEVAEDSNDTKAAGTSMLFDEALGLDVEVPEEYRAHHDCINEIFESSDFLGEEGEGIEFEIFEDDPETDAAFEACDELLPEKDRLMNEAFEKFDECLDAELGLDKDSTDQAWDQLTDATWEAAETACEQHLPPELLEMEKAWEAFDQCLEDNGLIDDEWDDFEETPTVSIMDGDKFSIVEFGEGDGSVTITRTNGEFTVEAAGDTTVEEINFDELDFIDDVFGEGHYEEMGGEIFAEVLPPEFAQCEEHLPADDFMGGIAADTVFTDSK